MAITSVLNVFLQRWDRERAEADRAAAEARKWQLEKARDHRRLQESIREEVDEAKIPTTGNGWNMPLLVLLSLLMSGCFFRHYTPVYPYQPVPPMAERPLLEDESEFNDREQVLAEYAIRLEVSLAEARAFAIEQNLANGYDVSPADEAWLQAYRSR